MGEVKTIEKAKNHQLGVLYLIISAFFFAGMAVFIRLAGDLPSIEKAFFRNVIAAMIAGASLVKSKERISVPKQAWPSIIMRALFGTAGILCNFYAIDKLLLSDASMLNKLSPFFAVLGSYFILKEKFTLYQGIAIIIAITGGLFIVKPSFSSVDFFPAVIGLAGGIAAGLAYSFLRKAGTYGVKGSFVILFFSSFSCLVMLPFLIVCFVPMNWYQIAMLLLCGGSAAGGQFFITAAYYHAPAREISIYDYSNLLFATIFGFFIFNQIPDMWSVIGYVIIVAMALWMFFYNRKR